MMDFLDLKLSDQDQEVVGDVDPSVIEIMPNSA